MKFLTIKEVKAITSLSFATIWRMERIGKFPSRRKISTARVGWVSDEIDKFMSDCINGVVAPKVKSKELK